MRAYTSQLRWTRNNHEEINFVPNAHKGSLLATMLTGGREDGSISMERIMSKND